MKQKFSPQKTIKSKNILQHEINYFIKSVRSSDLRIGLIFPNKYRIGMANLAMKIIYALWNQHEGIYVERIFQPESDLEGPKSIETGSPLKSFDVLAVTIQFELDYVNFLRMLMQGGIPIYRKDRDRDTDPLIVVGGPAVTTNPLVLSDFLDVVVLGEVEPISDTLLDCLYDRTLEPLKRAEGFYLPEDPPEFVTYARTIDYDDAFIPTAQVRNVDDSNWKESQVLGGYLIEPNRGCGRGCKFCLIGRLSKGGQSKPLRERSLNNLQQLSLEGSEKTGTKHLTLIGSGVGDYYSLADYLHFLNDNNLSFSIPSIRADSDREVITEVVRAGQKSLTIAPETGSDEFRYTVGKKISNETFFSFAQEAREKGISNLKMYLIAGLPNQTDEEIEHTITFAKKINQWFPKRNLNLTVSPFVPKRQTPFHNFKITSGWVDQTDRQLNVIKKGLKEFGSLHIGSLHWTTIQTILSIGDSSLAPVLEKMALSQGRYQDWRAVLGNPIEFLEQLNNNDDLQIPLAIK